MKITIRKLMAAVAALALLMLPAAFWLRRRLEYPALAAKYRAIAAHHKSKLKGYKCEYIFDAKCFRADGTEVGGPESYVEYYHQYMYDNYNVLAKSPWTPFTPSPPAYRGTPPQGMEFPDQESLRRKSLLDDQRRAGAGAIGKLVTAVAAPALLMVPAALWLRRRAEYPALAAKYREIASRIKFKLKQYNL